jgi:hypothetical protein
MARQSARNPVEPLSAEESARLEAFRRKVRGMVFAPMPVEALEERQERFREAVQNAAIEGIHFQPEERALFDIMDEELVPEELRPRLLREYLGLQPASSTG